MDQAFVMSHVYGVAILAASEEVERILCVCAQEPIFALTIK